MAVLMEERSKKEDLGRMIAKVQDDLRSLRTEALRSKPREEEREKERQTLESMLSRTEKNMQMLAERLLDSSHNEVATLPAVVHTSRPAQDEQLPQQLPVSCRSKLRGRPRAPVQSELGLSPGEESQMKHLHHLLGQPSHPLARQLLHQHYHLTWGLEPEGPRQAEEQGRVMMGTTVEHLTTLPRANRRNAMLTPPPIQPKDARRGLLSLLQRGLIPPAADLVLSPPPVVPNRVLLHSPGTPPHRHLPIAVDSKDVVPVSVKLDPGVCAIPLSNIQHSAIPTNRPNTQSASTQRSLRKSPLPPIASHSPHPQSAAQSTACAAHVIINNGRVAMTTNDFKDFQSQTKAHWHMIEQVLDQVVDLCQIYMVPVCILDCDRILKVTQMLQLGLKISRETILGMITNRRDVEKILTTPGRRFRGKDGVVAAANTIRATYLMYREVKKYREHHKKKWAADVVGTAWMTFMSLYKIKQKLKKSRAIQLASHRQRAVQLRRSWDQIQTSRRCIVHIPSLGLPVNIRSTINDMDRLQSMQIGRICDIQDPNVHVVYVSPVHLDADTVDYYLKLLSIRPADDSPSVGREDTPTWSPATAHQTPTDASPDQLARERLHVVIPENLEAFRGYRMSLSTVLLYSPQCLARIKRLVAGKPSYIVSGIVSTDDIALAHTLDLPLLGSEPEVSQLYSSKAGLRCLLQEAELRSFLPPFQLDIFSEKKFLESLAGLIVNNLLVPRWLFKFNHQVEGRGFAYLDVVEHLPCLQQVQKEAQRYGCKWVRPWAQEKALQLVTTQLPTALHSHTHMVCPTLYPTWLHFLQEFIQQGGLIEATPPSDSSTCLTVELLLEPTGTLQILATADKVCGEEYTVCGGSMPQCSLDHTQLVDVVEQISNACKERGLRGHLSLDLLTFISPENMEQVVWCVDADLCFSDLLAMYQLTSHVTGLQYHAHSGILDTRTEDGGSNSVFCVALPHLHHANLSFLYPAVFFQVCKAHHIGYDNTERRGTLFCLADESHRNDIGMACVDRSLMSVMEQCATNLTTINLELSTASLCPITNFKMSYLDMNEASITQLVQVATEKVWSMYKVIANELQDICQLMKSNL